MGQWLLSDRLPLLDLWLPSDLWLLLGLSVLWGQEADRAVWACIRIRIRKTVPADHLLIYFETMTYTYLHFCVFPTNICHIFHFARIEVHFISELFASPFSFPSGFLFCAKYDRF